MSSPYDTTNGTVPYKTASDKVADKLPGTHNQHYHEAPTGAAGTTGTYDSTTGTGYHNTVDRADDSILGGVHPGPNRPHGQEIGRTGHSTTTSSDYGTGTTGAGYGTMGSHDIGTGHNNAADRVVDAVPGVPTAPGRPHSHQVGRGSGTTEGYSGVTGATTGGHYNAADRAVNAVPGVHPGPGGPHDHRVGHGTHGTTGTSHTTTGAGNTTAGATTTAGHATMGDKIKGEIEVLTGKVTGNTAKVAEGDARKHGQHTAI